MINLNLYRELKAYDIIEIVWNNIPSLGIICFTDNNIIGVMWFNMEGNSTNNFNIINLKENLGLPSFTLRTDINIKEILSNLEKDLLNKSN